MTRTLARVALSAVLTTGVGLAVGAPASASSSSEQAVSAPEGKKKKAKKPTIKVAKTDLGKILVTTKGNTLYVFDPDGTDTVSPKCVDACADAWPAYAPSRKPKVKGLDKSLAGVGGGGQATYNSRLLYEFSGDTAAGDTNGQDVGGVWHVVGADGEPITS